MRSRATRFTQPEPLESRRLLATFVVDSTAHTFNTQDGNTTLEDAIFKANTTEGPDTIALQPGATYVLDHVDNTNWGSTGLNSIGSDITIEGNGATIRRSTAADTPIFRIFYIMSADRIPGIFGPGFLITTPSLTLNNLT